MAASDTYYAFGQSFVRGTVTTQQRVRATWVPSGGSELSVSCQVSCQNTWPDGSLRFAVMGVKVPNLFGRGKIRLYSEPGAQDSAIPGGRTVNQIASDLQSAHAFSVTVPSLYLGREKATITNAGSGYGAAPTVTISGGTPNQGNTGGGSTISGGAVDYVWVNVPGTKYTVAPSISFSSGSAAATFVLPTDQAAHTWSANTQLALLGTTDSRGRVRCSVVESGPLCVTFMCWGPFVKDADGVDHKQLVVRAWYRCWLTTSGAIDRVEYFHAVEQGWIGDLAGGSVEADLQTGDFTVKRNGSAIAGLSFTAVRIPHHTSVPLCGADMTTAGSGWTSGAPVLAAEVSKSTWRLSRLVPPYDLEYFASNPVSPATDTSPVSYTPGPGGWPGIYIGRLNKGFDSGGERDDIGLIPNWSAKAFLTQGSGYLQSDLATALYTPTMPFFLRNPDTGLIPVTAPSSAFDASANGLGSNLESTYFYSISGGFSSDIKVVTHGFYYDGDTTLYDPTNTEGGWYSSTGYTYSHQSSPAYHAYLRTGAPWFAESIKVQANVVLSQPPSATYRDANIPGTGVIGDAFVYSSSPQVRCEAWRWKMLAQALAVLPSSAERSWLQKLYDDNSAAAAAVPGALSANFRSLGVWTPTIPNATDPSRPGYGMASWQEGFIFAARSWAYLMLRDANGLTYLQHAEKARRGMAGDVTLGNSCPWLAAAYHTYVGESSDYYANWGQVPDTEYPVAGYGVATFGTDGWITGVSRAEPLGGSPYTPLAVGDRAYFPMCNVEGAIQGTGLPASATRQDSSTATIAATTPYYVAVVDTVNNKIRISDSADGSNYFTAFSGAATSWFAFRLATCPTGSPSVENSYFQDQSTAQGYTAQFWAEVRLGVLSGSITSGSWLTTFYSRFAAMETAVAWSPENNWTGLPKWRMGTI